MTVGSLFSGVGGFDLGLERAGMEVVWQVEYDKQAQTVLRHQWPDVDLHKDVCNVGSNELAAVDVICGGFPCQDLSVAGRREGLAGERSGLFYEFMRIVGELAPRWVLIENVPGLLSSNGGRDMGAVLGTLAELGYGWTYRIADTQYFGPPQRRRRVFIVGRAGGFCPPEVLLEPESLPWDPPPSREAGQGATHPVAGSLTGSGRGVERTGESRGQDPVVVSTQNLGASNERTPTLDTGLAHHNRGPVVAHTLRGEGFDASEDGTGRGTPLVAVSLRADASRDGRARTPSADAEGRVRLRDPGFSVEVERTPTLDASAPHTVYRPSDYTTGDFAEDDRTGTLTGMTDQSRGGVVLTPFDTTQITSKGNYSRPKPGDPCHPLAAGAHPPSVAPTLRVGGREQGAGDGPDNTPLTHVPVPRRLTPREAERLQGFPDDWTRYGRKPDGEVYEQADSPRYRQLGNAVSVPVAEWIGRRIMDAAQRDRSAA